MALTTVKSDQIQTSVALAGSPTTTTQSASDNSTKVATTAYADTAVANLVASAPTALNTLDELAAALNDDASFSTTVTNSIATKLPLAGGTLTGALTGKAVTLAPDTAGKLTIRLTTNAANDGRILLRSDTTDKVDIQANGASYFNGGNVGIGTPNPGASLELSSALTSAAGGALITNTNAAGYSAVQFKNTGGTPQTYTLALGGSTSAFAQKLYIYDDTDSAARVVLDHSGNVGIGIAGPSAMLDVDTATVSANPGFRVRRNHGGQAFQQLSGLSFYWNTTNGSQDNSIVYGASANSYLSLVHATGSVFNERVRITSTGEIVTGGLTSSTSQLHLYKADSTGGKLILQSQVAANATAAITLMSRLADNSNKNVDIVAYRGNLGITGDAGYGNVGIGTTSVDELLHVKHASSNAKILVETDSSTSISEIQFKSANNEIHRIGVETATGNQGYGGSQAYSLNMFARSGREIHFGSGTTQHMRIKDNGHVGVNIDPYAQFGVYRNHTDPYTAGSFLDYPTAELKHPSTTGSYNGTRYTNTAGNYEWFAGTQQTAGNAADFVFQGYDRGGATYKEMARIHDDGNFQKPYQIYFEVYRSGTQGGYNAANNYAHVVIYNGTQSNIGGHYNTSTGFFTAPITGVYYFIACAYVAWTSGQAWFSSSGGGRLQGTDMVMDGMGQFPAAFVIMRMTANDTIGFHPYASSVTNGNIYANANHTYFKGYFLG